MHEAPALAKKARSNVGPFSSHLVRWTSCGHREAVLPRRCTCQDAEPPRGRLWPRVTSGFSSQSSGRCRRPQDAGEVVCNTGRCVFDEKAVCLGDLTLCTGVLAPYPGEVTLFFGERKPCTGVMALCLGGTLPR